MKKALIVIGIIFGLFLMVGACSVGTITGTYDGAVTKQNDAAASVREVDNQYQRRYDLVPNLVETVKGYAAHERGVFEAVTEARAKVGQIKIDLTNATPEQLAAYQKSQGELTSALSRLLLIVENYPQLKANENFLALQSQLEGTENRIAVARKRSIDKGNDYNIYIQKFWNKLWLSMFWSGQFQPMPLFEAEEAARKAPNVDFSGPKK